MKEYPINIYLARCCHFHGDKKTDPYSYENAYQLYFCVNGQIELNCEEKNLSLSNGETVIVVPGMIQELRHCNGEILDIRFSVAEQYLVQELEHIAARKIVCEQAKPLFLQIAELSKEGGGYSKRLQELQLETAFYTILANDPSFKKSTIRKSFAL